MKIYSWNVNGIRAVVRKGTFGAFIKEHDPDVLCLQETKAMQGEAELDLPQYEEYWNSAQKKGYSGTAIFTKEKPVSVRMGFPTSITKKFGDFADTYGDPLSEGRIVVVELKKYFIATVYTPNAKDDLTRIPLRHTLWDPAFLAYMLELEHEKPVVFCGDLNVAHTEDDLARPKENVGLKGFTHEERGGFQAFVDAGFVDTLRLFRKGNGHYTWWSHWANARERNVGWRIDYVMVSKKLRDAVTSAAIHPTVLGSDHCPVSIELEG